MYLKILKGKENHNGLQYHTGLVKDILPFEPEGSCVSGGIYFTTPKHICKFLGYGVWVREVTIPNRARMVQDPEGDKWRANKVVLGTRKHLGKVTTWKWLVENGTDIHAGCDWALRNAASRGHLEIVKYLVDNGANIHACNNSALRSSAENGYLAVVKYLVEHGADIHACDDYALSWSAAKGYLEVVTYLVENGANIHTCDDEALKTADLHGHTKIVKYLKKVSRNVSKNT
jgi:hypothetical protein